MVGIHRAMTFNKLMNHLFYSYAWYHFQPKLELELFGLSLNILLFEVYLSD